MLCSVIHCNDILAFLTCLVYTTFLDQSVWLDWLHKLDWIAHSLPLDKHSHCYCLVNVISMTMRLGRLSEDSMEMGSGSSGMAPRQFKSKLEDALTAKQESEAKVAALQEKITQLESGMGNLKDKVRVNRKVSRKLPSDVNVCLVVCVTEVEEFFNTESVCL